MKRIIRMALLLAGSIDLAAAEVRTEEMAGSVDGVELHRNPADQAGHEAAPDRAGV